MLLEQHSPTPTQSISRTLKPFFSLALKLLLYSVIVQRQESPPTIPLG